MGLDSSFAGTDGAARFPALQGWAVNPYPARSCLPERAAASKARHVARRGEVRGLAASLRTWAVSRRVLRRRCGQLLLIGAVARAREI